MGKLRDAFARFNHRPDQGGSALSARIILLLAALLLVAGGVGGYRYHAYLQGQSQPALTPLTESPSLVAVHVAGAVAEPGLYEFPVNSRVNDAVLAASPLDNADIHQLNLAAFLSDGTRINVPARPAAAAGENAVSPNPAAEAGPAITAGDPHVSDQLYPAAAAESAPAAGDSGGTIIEAGQPASASSGNSKININTANSDQLQALSGIGAAKAAAIVAYREQHGAFAYIEQIKRVSGIGDGIFDQIKDEICVE